MMRRTSLRLSAITHHVGQPRPRAVYTIRTAVRVQDSEFSTTILSVGHRCKMDHVPTMRMCGEVLVLRSA